MVPNKTMISMSISSEKPTNHKENSIYLKFKDLSVAWIYSRRWNRQAKNDMPKIAGTQKEAIKNPLNATSLQISTTIIASERTNQMLKIVKILTQCSINQSANSQMPTVLPSLKKPSNRI